MKDIKVVVATHKKYEMPNDQMYIPIYVGAYKKENIGFQRDDEGKNISHKNSSFCELTALYWAWKNLDCDYLGLTHYRRHFKGKNKSKDAFNKVLSYREADRLLSNTDILVTKRRNYYIENIYDHYKHTLYIETLDTARKVILKKYPNYIKSFDKCMKHTHMHAFNMFIMKRNKLNEYCEWLFDILFELEEQLKDKQYNEFHSRYPGRVSELLLDVWLEEKGYNYTEVPFIYMEKINRFKKVTTFLKSKIFKEKYEGSF